MAELASVGRILTTAAAATLLFAGCSPSPAASSPSPSLDPAFLEVIDLQIRLATEAGVDSAQLALLDQAKAAGVVSHELEMQAFRLYEECLAAIGVRVQLQPTTHKGDYPTLDYVIYTSDTTASDACDIKTFEFLDTAYQLQPGAQAYKQEMLTTNRDALIACLRDGGVDVDDEVDLTTLELLLANAEFGFQFGTDAPLPGGPLDCLAPLGLSFADM